MKSIQLHTAALDNAGTRRDAGDIVGIGNGKEQIAADRARDLVANNSAADMKSADASAEK